MADQSYLFVDGAYLRQRHLEAITRVFPAGPQLDLSGLRQNLLGEHGRFQRVLYYDCIHDIPKVNETEDELKARVREQKEFFDGIQALHGFHLGLGSLSGSSRKMRQKEVDILLAVEMLEHAFRGNMTSVGLIAGDLDFAPLVHSLVRLGTWVDVFYDPKSIAQGLLEAADRGVPLSFEHYYSLCPPAFRADNPLPSRQRPATWTPSNQGFTAVRMGHLPNGQEVVLYERQGSYALFVNQQPTPWLVLHNDRAVLENYFTVVESPVEWQET